MLLRGATIGIIGGGQLGRMLAMAAGRLGFKTVIVEPQPDCPAAQMANRQITAAYDDPQALVELAGACDVVTYEFENIAVEAVEHLSQSVTVYPGAEALRVAQDRLAEKTFLREAGLATADFAPVDGAEELREALDRFGGKAIIKTRRFGYDGKGQVRLTGAASDPDPQSAIAELNGAPAIAEAFVDFACEISVIATRGQDGSSHCFEPARNLHRDGMLATSTVPSGLDRQVIENAQSQARALAEKLGYVGSLGLEFFVLADGSLIANEFAPRVHNSGHWTEAASTVSQFEQHVRAIAGWPLAEPVRHSDCEMTNLIGEDIGTLRRWAEDGAVMVHDYGKDNVRAARKMGHVTRLTARKA